MSYTNGRIVDNGADDGVSIRDVQRAVPVIMERTVNNVKERGVSCSLGTLIGAKVGDTIAARDNKGSWRVVSRTEINKWARYKPLRHSKIKPLTYQERKNAKFGLEVPYGTNGYLNARIYNILTHPTGEYGWNYLKPRGDRSAQGEGIENYRISDFVRHPSELSPSSIDPSSTDPTPVNLQGYNHLATVPIMAWLDSKGLVKKTDTDGEPYYEVNVQLTDAITVRMESINGDDLHLQDFINVDYSGGEGGKCKWRPFLQVYQDYYASARLVHWYDSENTADVEKASATPLKGNDSWSVSWPVTQSLISQDPTKRYHVCVGVACCDENAEDFVAPDGEDKSAFVLPYTDKQMSDKDYPFYYRFSFVTYISRRLVFTGLVYGYSTSATKVGDSSTFEVPRGETGNVFLTFTITKRLDQALHFIPQHGTADSGYDSLLIKADETIYDENYIQTSMRTDLYLVPSKLPPENRLQNSQAYVPTGNENETQTLYAVFNIELGNIRNGGMAQYRIYGNIGGVRWDNLGNLTIKKRA